MSAKVRRVAAAAGGGEKEGAVEPSIDEQIAMLQSMLNSSKISEERLMKAEKRHIRYNLVLRPKMKSMDFKDFSLSAVRRFKKQFYYDKRYPPLKEPGSAPGSRSIHVCTTRDDAESCAFIRVRAGERIVDPLDPKCTGEATGFVNVCTASLNAHMCGPGRCKRHVVQSQGILVCDITGLVLGTQISRAQNRWVRPGVGNDDGGIGPEDKSGGEDDGGCEVDVEADGEEHWMVSMVADADQDSGVTFADLAAKKRKLEAAATVQQASSAGKKRALPFDRAPVASSKTATEQAGITERQRTIASFDSAYRGTPGQLPEAFVKPSRFAPGSWAEKMMQSTQGGKLSTAVPFYGKDLLQYSFGQITQANLRNSEQICDALLFHPAAQRLFDEAHNIALAMAERDVDQYCERCRSEDRIPDRVIIYHLYWNRVEGLYASSLSRALSALDSSDLAARQYFTLVVVRLWKTVESTPWCCERNRANRSGSANKKRRTHTHLKKITPALYYWLSEGLESRVHYNKRTREVYPNDKDAIRSAPPEELESECVSFIPPHSYLKRRLPIPSSLARLDFSGVTGNGEIDLSIMVNQGFIMHCYRSLLEQTPPLSIEKVREYQLSSFAKVMDESPVDGAFVPVSK